MARERFGRTLKTYSLVFDETPQWNERPFVEAVLEGHDLDPVMIEGGGLSPLDALDETLTSQDGLFIAPALRMTAHVYREASADGCRVVLSGHGGDEVVSQGLGRLSELASAGRWLALCSALVVWDGAAAPAGARPTAPA